VGGDVVYPCTATVTDQQHSGSQLKYEWQTILRHNNHEHPEAIDNNVSTSTTISRIGCNGDTYYWMVRLKVTDAAGLSATDSSKIFPNCNTDNVPPVVTSVSPANTATNVAVNTAITANFNEAINGSTVTGTTFQLKDPGNNVINASLSTSSSQATLTPSAQLANTTTYTVTLKSGASGIKDIAGNALANDYNWSFTTIAGSGGGATYSIFANTATPAEPTNNDGQGIVLGMKFRSTQGGFITGVRYYKGAGTTGTHTGHLWNGSGTLLGSTTFAGETASGWQQTTFATPIAINANTTYVVSMFSPSGHYAATDPYFTSAVVNGPIRALADGEDGPNGLYRYSSTSVFPNSSFNSSNYWVDVVFSTGSGAQAVVVTTQPSPQSRCAGANASFSSAATGSPAPTVQWQASTNGTTWTNVAGATNSTLSFATTIGDNNKQYRAVWTNSSGSVNSNAAVLTVNATPSTPVVGVTDNCGNSVLTATGITGALLWSNGATTSSITVTTAGTYSVTQTINGCVSSPGSGIAAPLTSSVPAPTVTVTNNCGNSVLTATGTTGVLLWSNNATTSSITVTTAGTYSVTQTISGCVSPAASGVAAPKAIPVLSGSLAATATSGVAFTYTASSGTAGTSFGWSRAVVIGISNSAASGTGNISETLINTTASAVNVTYVYTLTANGCTNTQNLVVTVNPVGSQQPVTIQSSNTKTGTAATVHSLTAVPAGALLVLATTADAVVSNCIVSSSPALTWTRRADAGATSSDNTEIWTAVYSAGGAITVTSNWGGDNSQSSVCYVVLNAESTLGGASATGVLQTAPSVTITTTRANSIIFGCTADWKAIDGTTRTLRDAATERLYFKDGNFTTYHYTKAAGSIAAYTEGVSLPTGQQASTALLEIRAAAVATRPVNSVITGITNSNSNVDSYSLGQNYPNPFDKRTNIPFTFRAEQVNRYCLI
jgi:hypothetical protein